MKESFISLTIYLNLSLFLNISLPTETLKPSAYPHGTIAIFVCCFVVYEFEYPILYPFSSVFISATFDFKYPIFFNPYILGIESLPKNADPTDYMYATAFEALIGFLYLTKQEKRLEEILKMSVDCS